MAKSKSLSVAQGEEMTTAATEIMPIENMFIDRSYQRNLSKRAIALLGGENFNKDAVGVLHVNIRNDGVVAVIDGQHRRHVLMARGVKRWKCVVHRGLTPEEEAALFHQLNQRKNLTKVDNFRAAYYANDRIARRVYAVMEKHGYNLPICDGRKGNKATFYCVGTLYECYNEYGDKLFDRVISIIKASFTTHGEQDALDPAAKKSYFIHGLFLALDEQKIDVARVVAKLSEHAPGMLYAEATARNGCGGKRCGFTLQHSVAEVIGEILGTVPIQEPVLFRKPKRA